jgi:hypothetical protein
MDDCDSSVNVDHFKVNAWLLLRLSPLYKLQQHAARAFGMQEDTAPLGGWSWRLVEHLRPGGAQFPQRVVDIRHYQADVMQPAATLLQEAGDTAFWIGWFEQFDLTSIRATEREKCYTYAFLGEIEHTRRHDTEHITIKLERGIQVAYDYGNVVNALHAL